jgi:hypothetical protein
MIGDEQLFAVLHGHTKFAWNWLCSNQSLTFFFGFLVGD